MYNFAGVLYYFFMVMPRKKWELQARAMGFPFLEPNRKKERIAYEKT